MRRATSTAWVSRPAISTPPVGTRKRRSHVSRTSSTSRARSSRPMSIRTCTSVRKSRTTNSLTSKTSRRTSSKSCQSFTVFSLAVSSSALRRGNLPDTEIYRSVINNFNAKRSGEIYIVFEPNWFINDFDGLTVASTHGSPWNYDTYVPIVFAGANLTPRKVEHRCKPSTWRPRCRLTWALSPPPVPPAQYLRRLWRNSLVRPVYRLSA